MKTKLKNDLPLWQVAYHWLLETGNTVNEKFCREEITTHPDYPALTAVTDFLDSGNMRYEAVQADASYIHEFNYPLLAHIRQPGHEYLQIINAPADWDAQKEITQHWSGVVVYSENHAKWNSSENDLAVAAAKRNRFINYLLVLAGLSIYVFVVFSNFSFSLLFFGMLSLAGLVISIFITGTELGVQNNMVKQVCGAVNASGCTTVLKSRYSKGFAGFTTGDISVLYFAAQFMLFSISSFYTTAFISISWVALGGVFIATWSIYTQAVQLRQWCALCLGVVGVLLAQTGIAAYFLLQTNAFLIADLSAVIVFPALLLLLSLFYYPVKNMLKTNYTNKIKLMELKKWKMDGELFVVQLDKEQLADNHIWEKDLLLGNPEAPLRITVACNPYCGPCASAHKQLDHLLEKYAGLLSVQVRFLCNPTEELDKRTIAVKAILQKAAAITDPGELNNMLTDWFDKMNYEAWLINWSAGTDLDVSGVLQQHEEWVKKNAIAFTPTFFLNGKKLPGRYGLKELELLIPQLDTLLLEAV